MSVYLKDTLRYPQRLKEKKWNRTIVNEKLNYGLVVTLQLSGDFFSKNTKDI